MTNDEALVIVDRLLKSERNDDLNHLQELIFRQSWQNKTYQEIADSSYYTNDYVKENGAKLWQLLSSVLPEKITKKNFKVVLEKYSRQQKILSTGQKL